MTRALQVRRLGLVEYSDGLAAQARLVTARLAGEVPDTLLLLEHPRVLTLGRGGTERNVLWPRALLEQRGFELYQTNRGGDVTYHGPGQLVGYPILDLKPDRKDVRKYVASLEELMIRTAADYGVRAERVAGRTGIWTEAGKLGAIGVHLAHWITSHGFAFNLTTDLSDFAAIVPCGISDASVTSLEALLGRAPGPDSAPAMREVEERATAHAAQVWESEPVFVEPELRTISLTVLGEDGRVLLLHRLPERGGFWQTLTGRREPGESALAAAARELHEETSFAPRLEEIVALDYVHSFALGQDQMTRPRFAEETAFTVRVARSDPSLDLREHDAFRWCTVDEALALLPFAGLRRALRLAVADQSSMVMPSRAAKAPG